MKCGTTTLYRNLLQLSALYLPSDKEPNILTSSIGIEERRRAYRAYFRNARADQLCGEASTSYTKRPMFDGVAQRAYNVCGPQLKLIMVMRDPLERIYSHLRHNIALRVIRPDDAERAVFADPAYIAISDYAMQLEPWVETFGTSALHCLSLSRLRDHRQQVLQDISAFLGIPGKYSLSPWIPGISNKSTEMRYTSERVSRFLQTAVYRERVRPLLSDRARYWWRNLLLPRAKIPYFRLSYSVEAQLRERFKDLEKEIEQLIGRKIRLTSMPAAAARAERVDFTDG